MLHDAHGDEAFGVDDLDPGAMSLDYICYVIEGRFVHSSVYAKVIHDLCVEPSGQEYCSPLFVLVEVFAHFDYHVFERVIDGDIDVTNEAVGIGLAVQLIHLFERRIEVGATFLAEVGLYLLPVGDDMVEDGKVGFIPQNA